MINQHRRESTGKHPEGGSSSRIPRCTVKRIALLQTLLFLGLSLAPQGLLAKADGGDASVTAASKHSLVESERETDHAVLPTPSSRFSSETSGTPIIVVVAIDGTISGLSKETGEILWTRPGSIAHSESRSSNGMMYSKSGTSHGLEPLVATTTTTKSSSSSSNEWRTAAVPSVDGKVYLTSSETTVTTNIQDLVSRAPFLDSRGKFYTGSRHSTALAIDVDSGEILRKVSTSDRHSRPPEEYTNIGRKNVLWIGRVDSSISIHDARTGSLDVEFSSGQIISVEEMVDGNSDSETTDPWTIPSSFEHAVETSHTIDYGTEESSSQQLIATPSGNLAYREEGEMKWVACEPFVTPITFAIDSENGKHVPVDLIPDVPLPNSSVDYLAREMERQVVIVSDDASQNEDHTIVGALRNGQLFALPLGRRLNRDGPTPGIASRVSQERSAMPQQQSIAASSAAASHGSKQVTSKVPPIGNRQQHSWNFQNDGKPTNQGRQPLQKKPCHQSSPNFPSCLVGSFVDSFARGSEGDFLSESFPSFENNLELLDSRIQNALAQYHPYVPVGRPTPPSRHKFVKILESWLPPTVALIFVVSFELGRRKRIRDLRKRNPAIDKINSDVANDFKTAPGNRSNHVIQVSDDVLGYGGQGTVVYKGTLEGRNVAVKRMLKTYSANADREISLLIESDGHPNVVRYFLKETRGDFVYVALELCDLSLHDLIGVLRSRNVAQESSFQRAAKEILKQIACGIRHIHSLGIVHRDLKPANMLLVSSSQSNHGLNPREPQVLKENATVDEVIIDTFLQQAYVAKISDMGLGKQLVGHSSLGISNFGNPVGRSTAGASLVGIGPGSVGWQAPEVMAQRISATDSSQCSDFAASNGDSHPEGSPLENVAPRKTSRTSDIFALGCIFHSTLLPGIHPFGDWFEREANIVHNRPSLGMISDCEAEDLIRSMIDRNPRKRPTASEICEHPFFWSSTKKLAFLCDLSDRIESDVTMGRVSHLDSSKFFVDNPLAMERNAVEVIGTAWDASLDEALIANVQKFRTYDPSSIRDLLRLIRNKFHHYDELPPAFREGIGSSQSGLMDYFERIFPRLLMHCFSLCRENLSREDALSIKYHIPHRVKRIVNDEMLQQTKSVSSDGFDIIGSDEAVDTSQAGVTVTHNNVDEVSLAADVSLCEDEKDVGDTGPLSTEDTPAAAIDANDIVIWEGSAAAKTFNCRGWNRADSEWARRVDASFRKRDASMKRNLEDAKYRTRLCNHWDDSMGVFCPMRRRNKCVFAHGPVELRVKEAKRGRWGKLVDKEGNNVNPWHSGGEDTFGAARSIENARKDGGKRNTQTKVGRTKKAGQSNGKKIRNTE